MLLDAVTAYAINTMLALLLAVLITMYWRRCGRRSEAALWAAAAWVMAVADLGFLIRIWWSFEVTTVIATCLLTGSLLLIQAGIRRFCGEKALVGGPVAVLAGHVVVLACLLALGTPIELRMAANSLFWAGIALATARFLWTRGPDGAQRFRVLGVVVGSHGLFHGLRVVMIGLIRLGLVRADVSVVQSFSLCEASLFIVALFMGLLLTDMRHRQRALQAALEDVRVLSGLLPICSCCKKIRDDSGYWTRLETYLSEHSEAEFSHGICPDCAVQLYPDIYGSAAARLQRPSGRTATTPKAESVLR